MSSVLLLFSLSLASFSQAGVAIAPPSLSELIRDSDDTVKLVRQFDGDRLCRNQGNRLPTIRELALYAQSLGAEGISETPRPGFKLIEGADAIGRADNFYFSAKGYRPPAGELSEYYWWSSSPSHVTDWHGDAVGAYVFDSKTGRLGVAQYLYMSYYIYEAVRCLRESAVFSL